MRIMTALVLNGNLTVITAIIMMNALKAIQKHGVVMAKLFAINTRKFAIYLLGVIVFGLIKNVLKAIINVMMNVQKLFVMKQKEFMIPVMVIIGNGLISNALVILVILAAAALHGLMITQLRTALMMVTTAVAVNYNTVITHVILTVITE